VTVVVQQSADDRDLCGCRVVETRSWPRNQGRRFINGPLQQFRYIFTLILGLEMQIQLQTELLFYCDVSQAYTSVGMFEPTIQGQCPTGGCSLW